MSGTLYENQGLMLINPIYSQRNWRAYFELLAAHRDKYMKNTEFPQLKDTVRAVGYMYDRTFNKTGDMTEAEWTASRDTWTTARHVGAFYIAGAYHPCLTSSSSWRPTMQFITRYSSFLWDESIRLMDKPWEKITVISNREVWWEEAVYTKEKASYRDTIIHLLNCPETETVDIKVTEDPPSARDVEIEMELTEKKGQVKVWVMMPYDYTDEVREPKSAQITPKKSGNKIIFRIPPFTYSSMVVIREEKI